MHNTMQCTLERILNNEGGDGDEAALDGLHHLMLMIFFTPVCSHVPLRIQQGQNWRRR